MTCRKPRNATPAQNRPCGSVHVCDFAAVSSAIARTTLINGPAAAARLRDSLLRNMCGCRYTAPPGSPMPPEAMNSSGSRIDSTGCAYLNGFKVR